jgi:hypothetical protein
VEYLEKGGLAVIESIYGHIGGAGWTQNDTKWIEERIAKFLFFGPKND